MKKLCVFLVVFSVSLYCFSQVAYFDLTKILPQGYVTNGTVDYTAFLQMAINQNKNILFPNFPVGINDSGLKLKSNSTYKFSENSSIILLPSSKSGYNILNCNGKENITILNPSLNGDKTAHLGTVGEWGFGISIRGSKNIKIDGGKISNCFGDGIYIGRLNNVVSDQISITNTSVSNSRRNGLSLTAGTNITISNCKFLNSKGKGPSSGIDIEPNSSQDELKQILLENIYTANNENWGLLLNLVNLRKDNSIDKNISISVDGFSDNGSKYGMSFWLNRKNNYSKNIYGDITLSNVSLANNTEDPIKFYNTNDNMINLSVNKITVNSKNYDKLLDNVRSYMGNQKIKFNQLNKN